MKVALLYSYSPSGHARAAMALARSLRASRSAEVVPWNVCDDFHPILGPAVAKVYLELAVKTPALWDHLYDHRGLARATREIREFLHLLSGIRMAERLSELKPDLVVCTHAMPLGSVASLKRRGELRCPVAAAPTDFHAHGYWRDPSVDLYLAPTPEAAAELRAETGARVAETGILVDPVFERLPSKEEARRRSGLDPGRKTVLVSGGSRGLGPLLQAVETVADTFRDAQVAVLCGSNADLLEEGRRRFDGEERVAFFGFQAEPSDLVAAADVLVGKAGGLTLAEALAAGVPPLLFEPLPGQERRNAAYLTSRGAAWEAKGLGELVVKLAILLDKGGAWEALREKGRTLARPSSARGAASALLETLAPRPKPQPALL